MCNSDWTFVRPMVFRFNRAISVLSVMLIAGVCPIELAWAKAKTEPRSVTLSWDAKPRALRYDIEVGRDESLSKIFTKRSSKKPEVTFDLEVGSYFYRLRWVNQKGVPSPWSGVEALPINSGPPTMRVPQDGKRFATKLSKWGIPFQWDLGVRGSKFEIEIRDKSGVVVKREADKNYIWWKPNAEGKYSWRVCVETQAEPECGKFKSFVVSGKAVDRIIREVAVERLVALKSKLNPLLFRTNYMGVLQSGATLHTGEIAWSPEWKVGTQMSVGMLLGYTLLKAQDSSIPTSPGSTTGAAKLSLFVGASPGFMRSLSGELGAGIMYWDVRDTKYVTTAMANIIYPHPVKSLKMIDRAFIGYELALIPSYQTHFIRLGLGFNLTNF